MGSSKLPDSMESRLNSILKHVFVMPSVQMGIMGNPKKLNISSDSTNVVTAANSYGKRICNCRDRGIKQCDCTR